MYRFCKSVTREGLDVKINDQIFSFLPLGVASKNGKVFLFYKLLKSGCKIPELQIAFSQDGFNFNPISISPTIVDERKGTEENIKNCQEFRISKIGIEDNFLLYKVFRGRRTYLCGAVSKDLLNWKKIGRFASLKGSGVIVPDYKYRDKYVMYLGEDSVKIAFSKNLKRWKILDEPVLKPEGDFDSIKVEASLVTDSGVLLIYDVIQENGFKKEINHHIEAALFDKNSPSVLMESSELASFEEDGFYPFGAVKLGEKIFLYLMRGKEGVGLIAYLIKPILGLLKGLPKLRRFEENPIIKPIPKHSWESKETFNPAAVHEGGKVHILYRAIGEKDISVLGYASSKDGLHIDERLPKPVFVPREDFEVHKGCEFVPFYGCGGGYGGCEDPRITKIGDRFYMCYTAFTGSDIPRIALTSIKVNDFLNKKWEWKKPVLISPPDVVTKNVCILPEKINDKFVIFHRIFPSIWIDFVDNLNFTGDRWIWGKPVIHPRKGMWDDRKIGAGAPPIKTKDGWLLVYQGVPETGSYTYKTGAMLLDLEDPTKVLHRSKKPILEPQKRYEQETIFGTIYPITYPCGAVVIKNQLFVYYGAADRYVGVATANLNDFLDQLKTHEEAEVKPVRFLTTF